jgi:uncharacterized protein (DUF2062 family)
MIHLTKALVRRWLGALLHVDDTPERTAAAFALGVFFGFSPFLGLHTILGVVFAFMLNMNRVAVLLGIYSNLPWIIGPYYAFVTITAVRLMGQRPPPGFGARFASLFELSIFGGQFWHDLIAVLKPLLWPYTVGSLVGSLILAALSYPLALAFVNSRRRLHDWSERHQPH